MRTSRTALLATTVLCAFAVATYACGGDDDNATIPDADAGNNNGSSSSSTSGSLSSSSSSSGSSGSSTSSSSSSTSSSSSSSSSGNPVADAGEVGDASEIPDSGGSIGDASDTFDGAAGSLCQVNSVQEREDNGTAATANSIPGKTGTFCGSLSSSSDTDFITFVLPADATNLDISNQTSAAGFQLSGSVTVNGNTQTFALSGADAGNFPFVAGGTYTLQATSTAASAVDYIIGVTITEQPPATKCEGGSTAEIEPNDTDDSATPVTVTNGAASWCGVIASPTDTDEFSFTMPSGFGHLTTQYSTSGADLSIAISHNGTSVPNPQSIPIVAGDKYIFKFTSTGTNDAYIYKLNLSQ